MSFDKKIIRSIAREFDNVFDDENVIDSSVSIVSLYDVFQVIKLENDYVEQVYDDFCNKINEKFGLNIRWYIKHFYYPNSTFTIVGENKDNPFDKKSITFRIEKDKIYVQKGCDPLGKQMIKEFGEEIFELFDFCVKHKGLFVDKGCDIQSINSNFVVDTNSSGVSAKLCFSDNNEAYFTIGKTVSGCTEFYCHHISLNEIERIYQGRENELFKRVYVNIYDCPKWLHTALIKISEESVASEEEKRKNQKKETKKRFPFFKRN